MKFSNPFRKKANPEMEKCLEDRQKVTQNKATVAQRVIDQMNAIPRSERRFRDVPVDMDLRRA